MKPWKVVSLAKVPNQLTGPLVGLYGEDKYFGFVGVMDAEDVHREELREEGLGGGGRAGSDCRQIRLQDF